MLFVGAYWSAREETREEAAARIAEFLRLISPLDSFFAWFLQAKTQAKANVPVEVTTEWIALHLRAAGADSGSLMPQVGFSLNLWNGAHATLRVTIGAFSQHISNAVVLSFGAQAGEVGRGLLQGALDAVIRAFDPEHAVVTSNERMARAGVIKPWESGIFTYERGGAVRAHVEQD